MNTKNLCAAGVLLTAAATMVVLFLFRLSQPDKAQQSIFLNCTASDRGGWTFYTEAGANRTCVRFWWLHRRRTGGRHRSCCSGARHGGTRRTMLLQFSCVNAGLQVFWRIYFSTRIFRSKKTASMYFLQNADFAGINYNGLCIPLPLDCAGKTLRIVTYGPSPKRAARTCVSPHRQTAFRCRGADHRRCLSYMTAVTVKAYVGAKPAFGAGAWCSGRTAAVEAIALEWILLSAAVSGVCNTFLESASGLNADSGLLNWVCLIHMDFLYIYLAAELRGKTLGAWLPQPAAYSAYCLAEFCGGAASHRKVGDWLCSLYWS